VECISERLLQPALLFLGVSFTVRHRSLSLSSSSMNAGGCFIGRAKIYRVLLVTTTRHTNDS
jgi:hypothetical protein